MGVRAVGPWLLLAALLGCGPASTAPAAAPAPSPALGEEERAALLAQADALAEEHRGRAVDVLAVRTTSSTARDITGWSSQQPDEEVWVLHVSGDDYFCQYCSGPSDEGKQSRHLTLTVRAADPAAERLTFGMSGTPYDLSAYGTVQTLRDG